jgi:hypothetical protein
LPAVVCRPLITEFDKIPHRTKLRQRSQIERITEKPGIPIWRDQRFLVHASPKIEPKQGFQAKKSAIKSYEFYNR